jgi:putative hydrolase of the HAD superfamily
VRPPPPLTPVPYSPAGVRALFFDAVGTLLYPDPLAEEVYARLGRAHGSALALGQVRARFRAAFARQEEADRAAGLRTDEGREVRRWRAIVGEVLDDVADPQRCFEELYEYFARPGAWRCDPGAGPALAGLARRGYALGIASNFDRRLRGVVAGMPELAPVRHLVISSEVGWRKPAPEFFARLRAEAGLPADQVVLVGDDWVNDLEGATRAGLPAVLLDPRGRWALPPPARVAGLGELPGLFGGPG